MAEPCPPQPCVHARSTSGLGSLRPQRRMAVVLVALLTSVSAIAAPPAKVTPPPAKVVTPPPPKSVVVVTTPAPGAPPPSEVKATLEEAVNSFRYQDFDNAIPQLRSLLYPTPRVDRRREWQVREYLGAALWWTAAKTEANDEFTALLVRDPAHRLDPAVYPPKMVGDFETLRNNLVRLGVIQADAIPVEQQEAGPEPPPFGLMLVPFGIGQFANRSPGKGAAFLATEVALAAVSATFYVINQRDGLQGPGHMTQVNQITQLSAGGAFFAVAVTGIIEAAVHWNDPRPASDGRTGNEPKK